MKHLKTQILVTILFISTISISFAQSKIAHINTTDLIEKMPESIKASSELDKLVKTYDAEIQQMATELNTKLKQYQAEAASKTDEENLKRREEVQKMEASIQEYQAQSRQDLQKKQIDLLKPITERAKAAIEKIARAQGFQYVLDSSNGSGVIMAEGKDLMSDVKKELGF